MYKYPVFVYIHAFFLIIAEEFAHKLAPHSRTTCDCSPKRTPSCHPKTQQSCQRPRHSDRSFEPCSNYRNVRIHLNVLKWRDKNRCKGVNGSVLKINLDTLLRSTNVLNNQHIFATNQPSFDRIYST